MAAKRGMATEASGKSPLWASVCAGKREMVGLARRWIVLGAALTALGLAVAGTAPVLGTAATESVQMQQAVGGAIVLAGWALLAWGIHRLGRS
jgi:hypothetical protein